MLKIKDNVDLKELEKFGFHRSDYYAMETEPLEAEFFGCYETLIIQGFPKQKLYIAVYDGGFTEGQFLIENSNDKIPQKAKDIIKDLIQAGLVEEVGD